MLALLFSEVEKPARAAIAVVPGANALIESLEHFLE
jgi:hypothetical protein